MDLQADHYTSQCGAIHRYTAKYQPFSTRVFDPMQVSGSLFVIRTTESEEVICKEVVNCIKYVRVLTGQINMYTETLQTTQLMG